MIRGALLLLLLSASAGAAPLADRLPAGASLVTEADFAALRSAKVVDRAAWDAAAGPDVLERAGIEFRRDVDRLAIAVLPPVAEGKPADVVALMLGRFDPAAIKKSLVSQGAKALKLGDVPAWRISGRTSFELHPALPAIDMDADQVFVSFLGEMLVVGTERGTRAAHGPKEGLPSPALAAARASVPSGAAAWVAVDTAGFRSGDSGGALEMAQGLKSLTAWGIFSDSLEIRALATTFDAKQATQLAGVASMLAGIATSTPEGKLLKDVDIRAVGESVTASLQLTAAQIRELSAEEPAPAAVPPPKASGSGT